MTPPPEPPSPGDIVAAQPFCLADLVAYVHGSIVSRILQKGPAGMLTVMAFEAGEEVSEHSTPCDAYALVLDGSVDMKVGETRLRAGAGEMVLLPAGVPHSLHAVQRFKMLLVMLRN